MVAPFLRDEVPESRALTCVCCSCHREQITPEDWREHTPHADERLTHGICPACLYALYPDIAPLIRPAA